MTTCLVETPDGDVHGVELGDGTTCCTTCAAALARALADVPALLADLEVTLTRQDQLGAPGRSADGTLMWKPAVPDAVWTLGNTLTVWARELADRHQLRIRDTVLVSRPIRGSSGDQPVDPPALPDDVDYDATRCEDTGLHRSACAHCRGLGHLAPLPTDAVPAGTPQARPGPVLGQRPPSALDSIRIAAVWLYVHRELLRRDVEAHDATSEITSAIGQAAATCSAPPMRLYVGPCDQAVVRAGKARGDQNVERCGEDLYARPDFLAVTCSRCGTTHSDMHARWERALRRIRNYPATAAVIAHHVGELYGVRVDRKTINQWHHRERLRPVDHDDDGAPRFRIGNVLELARRGRVQPV